MKAITAYAQRRAARKVRGHVPGTAERQAISTTKRRGGIRVRRRRVAK